MWLSNVYVFFHSRPRFDGLKANALPTSVLWLDLVWFKCKQRNFMEFWCLSGLIGSVWMCRCCAFELFDDFRRELVDDCIE